MFVTNNNQLGFIHIPRTGGTSVSTCFAVAENGYAIKHVCRTHALYKEFDYAQPQQWFATIRHPAARLHSGYYYQLGQDQRRVGGTLPMKSDLTLDFLKARIDLFQQYGFEQTVISNDFANKYRKLKSQHNIKSLNALEQMQSVCEYIHGCKNIVLFDIDTQSAELFNWIKLSIPRINHVHVNQKQSHNLWRNELTDKLIDYINYKYKDDLERFGYTL